MLLKRLWQLRGSLMRSNPSIERVRSCQTLVGISHPVGKGPTWFTYHMSLACSPYAIIQAESEVKFSPS